MNSEDARTHLSALAGALPADGAATVPVAWLRALLERTAAPERELITPQQAAARAGVTVGWLYRHRELPFRVKLSHRRLMVDAVRLDAWLADRRGGGSR